MPVSRAICGLREHSLRVPRHTPRAVQSGCTCNWPAASASADLHIEQIWIRAADPTASIGEYRRAELLVDQDGGVVLRQAGSHGCLDTPIDHLLRRGDASTLIGCKQTLPAKHPGLE
jgi:hypothetical protein